MAHRNAFDLAASLGVAALHTGITLWYRWPLLMAAGTRPLTARDASELNRMVSEKVVAATKGLFDSHAEAVRLTTSAMLGTLKASDAGNAAVAITDASLRPALRTVRANARRLRKRG